MSRRSAHEISFFLTKNDGRRELLILDRLAYAGPRTDQYKPLFRLFKRIASVNEAFSPLA